MRSGVLLVSLWLLMPPAVGAFPLAHVEGGVANRLSLRPESVGYLGGQMHPLAFASFDTDRGNLWHGISLGYGRYAGRRREERVAFYYQRAGDDEATHFSTGVGPTYHWGRHEGVGLAVDGMMGNRLLGAKAEVEILWDRERHGWIVWINLWAVLGGVRPLVILNASALAPDTAAGR